MREGSVRTYGVHISWYHAYYMGNEALAVRSMSDICTLSTRHRHIHWYYHLRSSKKEFGGWDLCGKKSMPGLITMERMFVYVWMHAWISYLKIANWIRLFNLRLILQMYHFMQFICPDLSTHCAIYLCIHTCLPKATWLAGLGTHLHLI